MDLWCLDLEPGARTLENQTVVQQKQSHHIRDIRDLKILRTKEKDDYHGVNPSFWRENEIVVG